MLILLIDHHCGPWSKNNGLTISSVLNITTEMCCTQEAHKVESSSHNLFCSALREYCLTYYSCCLGALIWFTVCNPMCTTFKMTTWLCRIHARDNKNLTSQFMWPPPFLGQQALKPGVPLLASFRLLVWCPYCNYVLMYCLRLMQHCAVLCTHTHLNTKM